MRFEVDVRKINFGDRPVHPPGGPAVFARGTALVMPRDLSLPDVCCKCGTHAGVHARFRALTYVPLVPLLSLLCLVFGGITVIFSATEGFAIPLCNRCDSRYDAAIVLRRLALAVPVIAFVALVLTLFNAPTHLPGAFFSLLGSFLVPAIVEFAIVRPRTLHLRHMDTYWVTIAGIHEAARHAAMAQATAFRGDAPQSPR